MPWRTPIAAVAAAAAVMVTACVPPEPNPYRVVRHNEETVMGQIQRRGTLVVGIETNFPPFGFTRGGGIAPEGFTVEVAGLVARALGVALELEEASTDELLASVDEEDGADLVFPALAVTEQEVDERTFTDPYFVAHQRLLVKAASGIEDVSDLSGKRVCSFIDIETQVRIDALEPSAEQLQRNDVQACRRALTAGRVDAVTGPDAFLLAIADTGYEIVGSELTTEGFGGVVETGANGFANFVGNVLNLAEEDGRWSDAYERWVTPITGETPEPPELNVQEAALLNSGRGRTP